MPGYTANIFHLCLSLYISSCHKAHEALTLSFHPPRVAAKAPTVIHDRHPAACLSSWTILLHVDLVDLVSSSPLAFAPMPYRNVLPCSSSLYYVRSNSIVGYWSHHLLCSLLQSPGFVGVRWSEAIYILSMRFMHLYWKSSSFFASVLVSFQALQPYIKTALKIVLHNWIFVILLISLVSQILRNLWKVCPVLLNLRCIS